MASRRRGSLELGGALDGAGQRPANPARARRVPRARSAPANWRLALVTLGFAAFGAGLILIEDGATARSRVYTGTPEFKVWATLTIALIAALPTAFSALLVVNFLPAFRRLSRPANATIDAMLPVLPPGADGWQNGLQERTDLAGLLQVTSGAKDLLTSAVLVAGPLISSAFSMFLPGPPS